MSARDDLTSIFAAAICAVDPQQLVCDFLRQRVAQQRDPAPKKWLVVGAGKAAAGMAAGCAASIGREFVHGLVITADGCARPLRHIECAEAGHPIPDERGRAATARLVAQLEQSGGPVVALISGGASALLVEPVPGVTLADKAAVNRLLLRRGADIEEINTVRKHISMVKGGRLLRSCRSRPVLTLIISDVIGDAPHVIGSGPTVPDPSTYAEAMDVLRRHRIDVLVPLSVRSHLERGARGEVEETVKPGAAETVDTEAVVLADNRTALAAAARESERLGYRTIILERLLSGDTRDAARVWLGELDRVTRQLGPDPWCVIAGGETTVEVRGTGRGGRNQEFALALVNLLAGRTEHVLSAGTDGIDGPTDAAGAFVDGTTALRAQRQSLPPATALEQNDSYAFFDGLGDLFRSGPTGTNVMDIKIAVRPPE